MSRARAAALWLILLLVPVAAVAQRGDVDRSRTRSESNRTVDVDRSAKRTKVATQKGQERKDQRRLREDKVSQSEPKRDEQRNRVKARSERSSRTTRDSSVRGSDSGSRGSAPAYDRSTDDKQKQNTRREVKRRPNENRDVRRDPARRDEVKHSPVRRNEVKHKPSKRREVKHRPAKHESRRAAPRRHHQISHFNKRYDRHAHKRYVYKHRRYHRHHSRGVSIGFYIRIPTVRWHVGHSRRFAYRQIVSGHPAGDVEVVSTVRRKIRSVHREYVDVEFELVRLDLSSAGRFLGTVDRFPGDLRRMRAKIYRDGFVQFDRMLYVVGNDYDGFELLSTRYCGGDLGRASYECLDPKAGEIDFYDERVHSTRYSRLLPLAQTGRSVPVALVPDEEYLGFQYMVGYGGSSDGYYSGSFDYSSLSRYDGNGTAFRISAEKGVSGFESAQGGWTDVPGGFAHQSVVSYPGENGVALELQRQSEIVLVDD